jgi:hypothetical protein
MSVVQNFPTHYDDDRRRTASLVVDNHKNSIDVATKNEKRLSVVNYY